MSKPFDPRTVSRVWLATLAGTAVWLAAIFAAPWLMERGATGAARFIYAVFAPTCHQIPARCLTLAGHPLAVCGRCLGIYAGFAAGLVVYPLIRGFRRLSLPKALLLAAMTLPMAVDGIGGILGSWRSPVGLRFATGLVWGTLLPYYFVPGMADFLRARAERRRAAALENQTVTK